MFGVLEARSAWAVGAKAPVILTRFFEGLKALASTEMPKPAIEAKLTGAAEEGDRGAWATSRHG